MRRLFRAFARLGEQAIVPACGRCGQRKPRRSEKALRERVQQMRLAHPTWGAALIRVLLQQEQPRKALPCVRTLQRWLSRMEAAPAPAGRRPNAAAERSAEPHATWQVDGSEEVALLTGQRVSWLQMVDECSGAILETWVFARRYVRDVDRRRLQNCLREAFSRWGRPGRLRVDNGFPWATTGEFPSELSLWVLGLGIGMIWIPPGCPQSNGVVERSQGVGKSWGEPGQCRSARELQRRLDEMNQIQRERYPYCQGLSRMAFYPGLAHSGRIYDAAWEKEHWSLERVHDHVAGYVVTRRVDRAGLISLYNRSRYVGKHHAGERVQVFLDPLEARWVVCGEDATQLRTFAADELTRERILALDVSPRRPKLK